MYIYTYVDIHTEVTNKFHRGSGDHESLEILQEFCEIQSMQSTQNQKSTTIGNKNAEIIAAGRDQLLPSQGNTLNIFEIFLTS